MCEKILCATLLYPANASSITNEVVFIQILLLVQASGADPGFPGGRFTAWVRMRANIGPRLFWKTTPTNGQQVQLHGDKLLENSTFQVVLV